MTTNKPYSYDYTAFDLLLSKANKIGSKRLYFHTVTYKNYYQNQHQFIYSHFQNYLSKLDFSYIATIEFSQNVGGWHLHILTNKKALPVKKEYNIYTSKSTNYKNKRVIKYITKKTNYIKTYYYNCTHSKEYNRLFSQKDYYITEKNILTKNKQNEKRKSNTTKPTKTKTNKRNEQKRVFGLCSEQIIKIMSCTTITIRTKKAKAPT
ncbi:MAG: hypothetical protein JJT77_11815 [Crocinitomicaceae bacterium]|nr:hypothetical protein [Crocinitomicaceae bacterium]